MITLFYSDNQPVNESCEDGTILTSDCEVHPANSLLDRMDLVELSVDSPLDFVNYAVQLPEEAPDLGSIRVGDLIFMPKANRRAVPLYPRGREFLGRIPFYHLIDYTFYRVVAYTEDLTVKDFIEWEYS